MNKLITILMIFVLLTPLAILAQEVSEVENPNEPLVEGDLPQEAEPIFFEEPVVEEFIGEVVEPQCVEGTGAPEPCYAGFRFVECVDGFWQVNQPTVGVCNVECIVDENCRGTNPICMEGTYQCGECRQDSHCNVENDEVCLIPTGECVIAPITLCENTNGNWEGNRCYCTLEGNWNDWSNTYGCINQPEADPKEQLCKDTNGTWITNAETPSNVEEARCDCSQIIGNDKWKWHPVEGCKIVIHEAHPDPIEDPVDEPETSSNGNTGTYTSSSAIRLHYPQEVVEETTLEETAEEEIVEETVEEPKEGFFNAITGFFAGYGSLADGDVNLYLYPLAVLLCLGIIVFVAREY